MAYDLLGRLIERDEPEGLTLWSYDTAAKGIGKLAGVTTPGGFAEEQIYDSLGRPSRTVTTVDGTDYESAVSTDTSGRPSVLTYPLGFRDQARAGQLDLRGIT